jgi:hypothetical protein
MFDRKKIGTLGSYPAQQYHSNERTDGNCSLSQSIAEATPDILLWSPML